MPRSPAARMIQLVTGLAMMIVAPVTIPLPGPGATLMFAGGLVLVLRNSRRARVRFVRGKRRYPRVGAVLDRVMRRKSAIRRRTRAAAPAPCAPR